MHRQASLGRYEEALEDAERVTELKPDWPKGYSRVGAAAFGTGDYDRAISAYEKGGCGAHADAGKLSSIPGLSSVSAWTGTHALCDCGAPVQARRLSWCLRALRQHVGSPAVLSFTC